MIGANRHADRRLHRGAAHQPDAIEQGSQIPDIERRFLTVEANIFFSAVGITDFRQFFDS